MEGGLKGGSLTNGRCKKGLMSVVNRERRLSKTFRKEFWFLRREVEERL